jgi:hypothetical protein
LATHRVAKRIVTLGDPKRVWWFKNEGVGGESLSLYRVAMGRRAWLIGASLVGQDERGNYLVSFGIRGPAGAREGGAFQTRLSASGIAILVLKLNAAGLPIGRFSITNEDDLQASLMLSDAKGNMYQCFAQDGLRVVKWMPTNATP